MNLNQESNIPRNISHPTHLPQADGIDDNPMDPRGRKLTGCPTSVAHNVPTYFLKLVPEKPSDRGESHDSAVFNAE